MGLEYDKKLDADPNINGSLPSNNESYCLICYEELESGPDGNEYSLKCKHTFRRTCWEENLALSVSKGYHGIDANCM